MEGNTWTQVETPSGVIKCFPAFSSLTMITGKIPVSPNQAFVNGVSKPVS